MAHDFPDTLTMFSSLPLLAKLSAWRQEKYDRDDTTWARHLKNHVSAPISLPKFNATQGCSSFRSAFFQVLGSDLVCPTLRV